MRYLTVKNLCVKKGKTEILKDINISLDSGERIGIIGKNGAGKTTLVETIMGITNVISGGSIEFENKEEKAVKAVFQNYEYDRIFSIKFIYESYKLICNEKPSKNLKEDFAKYNLEHCMKKRYSELSGGEKQKFKIMMCLEFQPKIVVLDEVTTSLDVKWKKNIINSIETYLSENQDSALILISHDYEELKRLTNKWYLVKNGKNYLVENLDEIFSNEHNWN